MSGDRAVYLRLLVEDDGHGNDSTLEGRQGYGESAPGEVACQAGQHGGTRAAGQ
jgi:hypothetical protein